MKDIVHTPDFPNHLKLVCNMSNSSQDLKWSNKMLLQVGRAREFLVDNKMFSQTKNSITLWCFS